MLLKSIGCILIMFSSVQIGLNYIKNIKSRESALCEIYEFINIIKIKTTYELCDLPDVFRKFSDKYLIADYTSKYLNDGNTLKTAWNRSVDEYAEKKHLKPEDIKLLKDFSVCLGQTDIEGQISNFDMYLKFIENSKDEAKNEIVNKSKVIFSTSIFAGLLVSILVI